MRPVEAVRQVAVVELGSQLGLVVFAAPKLAQHAQDPGQGEGEADPERSLAFAQVAARFHNATAAACAELAAARATELVVLSGGVFQNRLLLERSAALLAGAGLRPLLPERLPPNDGGISYGQAAIAAALSRGGR